MKHIQRMVLSKHEYYITLIMLSTVLAVTDGSMCKWSNEDCLEDFQCCSKRCVKVHQGTDPRCASSPMHYPCFFSYQCEDGLACGEFYSCCSPFWGVCTDQKECCDVTHECREEEGFTYNRCLLPSTKDKLAISNVMLSVFLYGNIVWILW